MAHSLPLRQIQEQIVADLLDAGILIDYSSVVSCDYFPPFEIDFALRLKPGTTAHLQNKIHLRSDTLILDVNQQGVFLNINLRFDAFYDYVISQINAAGVDFGLIEKKSLSNLIVEHTSLNPIMPINLATFRTSVVGDSIATFFRRLGVNVRTHFWVEYVPRKFQPIVEYINHNQIKIDQIDSYGKPDHTLATVFISVLAANFSEKFAKALPETVRKSMFPKTTLDVPILNCPPLVEYKTDTAFAEAINRLKDICIQGIEQTLRTCDIHIDRYDVDDLYSHNNTSQSLSTDTYPERNFQYHLQLHNQYSPDLILSVVSRNLQNVVQVTEGIFDEKLKERGISRFCQIGELVVSNRPQPLIEIHGAEDVVDQLKTGRFHSVDGFLEYNSQFVSYNIHHISNCLKFEILRVAAHKRCVLSYVLNEKSEYFVILSTIEQVKKYLENERGVSIQSVDLEQFSAAEKRLIKYMGYLPEVTEKILSAHLANPSDNPLHLIPHYLLTLRKTLLDYRAELDLEDRLPQRAKQLMEGYLIVTLNALEMIGIRRVIDVHA